MKLVIILILLINANNSWAGDVNLFGVLPAISQTGRINDVFDYNLFLSTTVNATDRTIDGKQFAARDIQFYFQPSLIYKYSPQLNFAVAYVYQRTNPLNEDFTNENRAFPQIIFSTPFRPVISIREPVLKNGLLPMRGFMSHLYQPDSDIWWIITFRCRVKGLIPGNFI